jgi:hypothetical protein
MKIKTYYFLLNLLFLDSFLITCGIILSTNLIITPLKNQLKKQ